MSGVGWWFATLMVIVAGYETARLVTAGFTPGRVAVVVMTLAMALMFAPSGPKPTGPWVAGTFMVLALLCLPLRGRDSAGGRWLHGVTGCIAMAYMVTLPAASMHGIKGMAMTTGGTTWAVAALVGYFLAEATWSGLRLARPATPAGRFLDSAELETASHIAVAVSMSFMFLTML